MAEMKRLVALVSFLLVHINFQLYILTLPIDANRRQGRKNEASRTEAARGRLRGTFWVSSWKPLQRSRSSDAPPRIVFPHDRLPPLAALPLRVEEGLPVSEEARSLLSMVATSASV